MTYNIIWSVAVIRTATLLLLIMHTIKTIVLGKVMKMLVKKEKMSFLIDKNIPLFYNYNTYEYLLGGNL